MTDEEIEALATLSPYLAARARLATAWEELTSVVFRPVVRLLDLLTDMVYLIRRNGIS